VRGRSLELSRSPRLESPALYSVIARAYGVAYRTADDKPQSLQVATSCDDCSNPAYLQFYHKTRLPLNWRHLIRFFSHANDHYKHTITTRSSQHKIFVISGSDHQQLIPRLDPFGALSKHHQCSESTAIMPVDNFMQLQTAASANAAQRPLTQPMQARRTRENSADSAYAASTSSSASSSSGMYNTVQVLRCARCQRSMSASPTDPKVPDSWSAPGGPVQFGHNLYYCGRCASMVGLKS
jgi:hypothetical protein